MKKRNILIIIISVLLLGAIILFLSTGRARTDVFLSDFIVSDDNDTITLKVGVTSSAGYIRKMKNKNGGDNHYLTFYSTFGINSKLGSNDTFKLEVNKNATEIYFYNGNGGYKKVLEKDKMTGKWLRVASFTSGTIETIPSNNCDKQVKLYYSENDINVYTYCLDDVKVGEEKQELKEYLKEKNVTIHTSINYLIDKLTNEGVFIKGQEAILNDGGSKMYINDNINILMCNTLEGNQDIYIGNGSMKYESNFCK